MVDYTLFYWPGPFGGQFIRAILAYARKTWTEGDPETISDWMDGPVVRMPVPFVGPPLLVEARTSFAIAEMLAIVLYLGETLGLMPLTPTLRALTMKTVNDANDVIDELTINGGRQRSTCRRWDDYVPRLERWMTVWEETGRRNGLTLDGGFLLGGEAPALQISSPRYCGRQ